jgi:Rhodopirellula transposase DDE domain
LSCTDEIFGRRKVVIETIAATTTRSGLTVEAVVDPGTYPIKLKVTNAQMRAAPLTRQAFHGEWNYTVHSGPIMDPV